ncbi:MAG TPA: hypothetical protein VHE30_09010 [Polyangiaceae bacterium]|nr:hypothetical protein [Polyangiaceae bacterium]
MNRSRIGQGWFQRNLVEVSATIGLVAAIVNGCGGTVVDGTRHGQNGEDAGPGASGGNDQTDLPTCGNGIVDPGEVCDGWQLAGKTCATATMGMRPGGKLACNESCKDFDTTFCKDTQGGNTGGVTGTGGYGTGGYGTGGYRATGGGPPVYVDASVPPPPPTYCESGMPDPSGQPLCIQDAGVWGCTEWVARELGNAGPCVTSCSCDRCPTEVANCLADPTCAAYERCAIANGCSAGTPCTSCNQFGYYMKAAGLDQCLMTHGCSFQCFPEGGLPVP